MVAKQRQHASHSVKPLAHCARMHGATWLHGYTHHSATACESSAKTSTSTYHKSLTLYKAMAAAGWSPVAVAAVVVVALLSSSRCAATAAASSWPLTYAGSSSPSTSLDCGTMTSLLAGCRAFVRRGEAASSPSAPAPGAACCEGVAELYAVAADSADNWRSVCGCMAALVRRYSSNASAIALLPVLCGVLPPAGRTARDTLTCCTSPP
uniref:Bifunctional inhibitor/plant lipid transfer protein/seed storage helical domain-containing protein n=1 Tax=Setaria viridis TaxID=4556 RepID=A0A4U6VSK4_SETVI|nr:hypothetical protein SEVIR_2G132600v2 [Setaria viridis]